MYVLAFCAAVSAGARPLAAQVLTPPNIKTGLWETIVYGDDGVTVARKSHACYTADELKTLDKLLSNPGCTVTHHEQTEHRVVLDSSCNISGLIGTSHTEMDMPDDEHTSGQAVLHIVVNGKPVDTTVKTSARYIGPDCGSVQPGRPVPVR